MLSECTPRLCMGRGAVYRDRVPTSAGVSCVRISHGSPRLNVNHIVEDKQFNHWDNNDLEKKKDACTLKTPHVVFLPVIPEYVTGPLTLALRSQWIVPMNIF